jgi:heme/copper-type cytochrome/quinol oxidase subunit 3
MGIPTSEVGYTSATTGRGDHEVHKGHVVGLDIMIIIYLISDSMCFGNRSGGYFCVLVTAKW